MTSVFAARRAAEEFADLVDGVRRDVADRYAGLTSVVTALTASAPVTARPDFVADLRSQLMAAADLELTPAPVVARSTTRTPARPRRLGAAAAAALVVVGGTTGIAAAAQSALPGDGLYSVKRGIEAVGTVLSTSDAGKGSDMLAQAQTRLHEVAALRAAGADKSQIRAALRDFRKSATQGAGLLFRSYEAGGDSADIAAVRSFAASQAATLRSLADLAPAGLAGDFADSTGLLGAIDTQAQSLCAGCGSGLDSAGDVSSASALVALLAAPAAATAPAAKPRIAPARKAAAPRTTSQPAKTLTTTATAPVTAPAPSPSATPSTATDPIKKTVSSVTEPLTSTVDQLGQSTGLTPITDPVGNLLDGLGGN